ncbi:hypothetical protein DKX38_013560 [Salix brachista]|uniref:Protein kinase domain-containing protein n=1 Tax=Salix brachista TaxID=2182728 RepID=A0A5N5LS26_9ROSI|nr:hypothetical protein DKX38_013560 [Salix brachista]
MSCVIPLDFLTFLCASSDGSPDSTFEENQEKKALFPAGCKRLISVIKKISTALDGGYAEVYKGHSEDEQFVAIKRLNRGSPEEMTVDFLTEPGITVHVDRPNIAKVIGHGVEGGMHLVLEFVRRIFHKDTANKMVVSRGVVSSLTLSEIEGTFGYLPPGFFTHGKVDETTDVYAYGVLLLLELITECKLGIVHRNCQDKPLLVKNSIKELVDPTLGDDAYDSEHMDHVQPVRAYSLRFTEGWRWSLRG